MAIGSWMRRGLAAVVASLSIAASAQGLSHWPDAGFGDSFDGVSGGPASDNEAARFLAQATFGPSPNDIAHLRSVGYTGWLNEQFAAPVSTQTHYLDWFLVAFPDDYLSDDTRLEVWAINSVGTVDPSRPPPNNVATDQLRQRIAFALSEIFVVSNSNGTLAYEPWALASFYDMLAGDAFGNYRTLLEDVSKHPAMGIFLSSIQNQKADATQNIHPDENYAREVMQLFSIGLKQLNADGTPVLVGGQEVPTYDQTTVRGFAAVFTGWDWNNTGCGDTTYTCCMYNEDEGWGTYFWCGPSNYNDPPWMLPMEPVEHYHDNTSDKQLLVYPGVALPGGVLVHGGDAQTEMTHALDNIFNHPNVGPFIATRLIERLVTSNPTPAYVQRVAAAFADNGSGQRGDMKAVIRAVLLDPEARAGDTQAAAAGDGKLREPALYMTRLLRAFPAKYTGTGLPYYSQSMKQDVYDAPSVFNFYPPSYRPQGYSLLGPEFKILDSPALASRLNFAWDFTNGGLPGRAQPNFNALVTAAADNATLIATLDRNLLHGTMPDGLKSTIAGALTASGGSAQERAMLALYLVAASPAFNIQK